MLVRELMTKLSFNELSNMSLGMDGIGSTKEESHARIIDQINNALLDLHTRFLLKESQLVVKSYDWKSNYKLIKEHAVTNDAPNFLKFIQDTPTNPYVGDLINIMQVYNEEGRELPINDSEQWASVFTPTVDTLQLTHPGAGQVFFVTYRARHPRLTFNTEDVESSLNQEVIIPLALENALRYQIARGIYSPIAGQESSSKTQEMMAYYEAACIEIETKGLLGHMSMSTNVKLNRRGFV